jgi:prepilin-type N-terminal cleavage/methylation domain-containing protein
MRSRAGFTIYELMIVIAIMGFIAAMAVPSLNRYRLQEATRGNAQVVAGAMRVARDRAVREGRQWFVLFNAPASAPGAIARVVQDVDNNWQETPGIDVARDVFFQPGSSTEITPYGLMSTPFGASPRTQHDQGGGNLGNVTDGSGFPLDPFTGSTGFGFTPRGIPVNLQTPAAWGSGIGAYYVTDNNANVYAVDVGPLGEVKVRALSAAQTWN